MRWLMRLVRRTPLEAQLDAELRDHVERQIAAHVAAGLDLAEARRRALLAFGGSDQVKEQCRDARGTRPIDDLIQDLRYAARVFRKSPGFVCAAVASLALGIGANTAVFSLIDAALLKPLPVPAADRLVEPSMRFAPNEARTCNCFSYPALAWYREHATTLDGIIASHSWSFFVTMDGAEPERGAGQYVTGNFFEVLGVAAPLGRTLQPDDDRAGSDPVVVLSDAWWKRRFGGDPSVLGRRLTIDDRVFTIVGVTPPAFRGTGVGRVVDFWIPLATEPLLRARSWMPRHSTKWLNVLGRLKPGVGIEEARAELEALFGPGVVEPQIAEMREAPQKQWARGWRLVVVPARAGVSAVRQELGTPLFVLLGVSGSLLLIACVNVANLFLARASVRRREIAIRLALGASRGRVVRQLLTESLLLACAGAVLGVGLAYAGCRYLLELFDSARARIVLDVHPDLRMLAFAAALALATGIVFGLAPAWRSTRHAGDASLLGSARVRGAGDRRTMSRWLIAGQVALSVVMLVCAGLFLRSLHNLRAMDTGFDGRPVLLLSTDASRSRLTKEAQRTAYRDVLARLRALPGVQSASLSAVTPIEGGGTMLTVQIDPPSGASSQASADSPGGASGSSSAAAAAPSVARGVHMNWVSPAYFATMGTPLRAGRDFTWQDTVDTPKVAIINQTMARESFPHGDAIGRRVRVERENGVVTFEIVAIAADAKYLELRQAVPPTMYFAAFQQEVVDGQLAVRTVGAPLGLAAAARAELRAVAPTVAVTAVRTLAQQVEGSIVRERLLGVLSGFFAALGLLLASVGLYGVMAYTVTQRTSEIGIRMALGARPAGIASLVLRQVLLLTAGGIIVGLAAALLLGHMLRSLLFGLTPTDPFTIAVAIAVMAGTAVAAAWLPSRRAARLDPTVALRHE